jgi:hypothetical protein
LEEDLRASKDAIAMPASEDVEDRDEKGCGWVACTTDSILAMKSSLYDVLITLPPLYSEDAAEKVWPKVKYSQGIEIKATQRDLRRYKALRWALSRYQSRSPSPISAVPSNGEQASELLRAMSSSSGARNSPMLDIPETDSIVEPISWSALAYSGFMWWASAGEQRLHSDEDSEADNALLSSLSISRSRPQSLGLRSRSATSLRMEGVATQEMGIIAYFHRVTTEILKTLSDIADVTDSDDERDDGDHLISAGENTGPAVYVSSADMARMGLDVWSTLDHAFVEDVAREFFGMRAQVEGRTVDMCGIRIC